MNYEEAIHKSLTVRWKVDTCASGEECWCRVIKCEEPLMYKEMEDLGECEYFIVRSGYVLKETAEHIVKLHNAAKQIEE